MRPITARATAAAEDRRGRGRAALTGRALLTAGFLRFGLDAAAGLAGDEAFRLADSGGLAAGWAFFRAASAAEAAARFLRAASAAWAASAFLRACFAAFLAILASLRAFLSCALAERTCSLAPSARCAAFWASALSRAEEGMSATVYSGFPLEPSSLALAARPVTARDKARGQVRGGRGTETRGCPPPPPDTPSAPCGTGATPRHSPGPSISRAIRAPCRSAARRLRDRGP